MNACLVPGSAVLLLFSLKQSWVVDTVLSLDPFRKLKCVR